MDAINNQSIDEYIRSTYTTYGRKNRLLVSQGAFLRIIIGNDASKFPIEALRTTTLKLWPALYPVIETVADQNILIKSVYAEYGRNADNQYKGHEYMEAVISTQLALAKQQTPELRIKIHQRLKDLETLLTSGLLLKTEKIEIDKIPSTKNTTFVLQPVNDTPQASDEASTSTINHSDSRVASFFQSFEFSNYTFRPSNTVSTEFDRLCKARQWPAGGKKALAAKAKLNAITADNTYEAHQSQRLHEFFKAYEFSLYQYDRTVPPGEEFLRLTTVRKWGSALAKFHEAKLKAILQVVPMGVETSSADTPVALFAKPVPLTSSSRNTSKASMPNKTERTLAESPLARFFTKFNCARYQYSYRSGPEEFNKLTNDVMKPDWMDEQRRIGRNTGSYWKSKDHEDLKRGFEQAVEAHFDYLVKNQAKKHGIKDHEYVVMMLDLGTPPMKKDIAKEILKKVNVNIYDFIDYEQAVHMGEIHAEKPTKYPSSEILGIYSWATGRIYDLESARESGTFVLLLHKIGRFFKLMYVERYMNGKMNGKKKLDKADKKVIGVIEKFLSSEDGRRAIVHERGFGYHEFEMEDLGQYRAKWERLFCKTRSS